MGSRVLLSDATLISGPSDVCEGSFPSGNTSIPVSLSGGSCGKAINVETGAMLANVQSPSSFQALPGIGSAGPVTQAVTLYINSPTQVLVQLTMANPAGGSDIVSVVPLQGIALWEFPSNGYVKSVGVQGASTVQYYASGLQ